MTTQKTLIAYFSRKGENYVRGKFVDLAIGNTAVVANFIKEQTQGKLFEIETIKTYPADYQEKTEVAKQELVANARPELTAKPESIAEFDTIYLGYPNWWNTMPMAVCTFLESYDFTGKTIRPFCTHEGSGIGKSEQDIAKLCPTATVTKGLDLVGSDVAQSQSKVEQWVNNS